MALARKANVSQEAVTAYELGVRRPKIGTAIRLANALGCSPWEILPPPAHVPTSARRLLIALDRASGPNRRHLLEAIDALLGTLHDPTA